MKERGKKSGRLSILMLALAAVTLFSCEKKDKKIDLNPSLNVANDIIIAQRPVFQAFRMLVRAVNDTLVQQTQHGIIDGALVTFFPEEKKYTFLFHGGYSPDQVARAGTIEAILSGDFALQGTAIRFTFDAYQEDGNRSGFTDTVVNTGPSGNNLSFSNRINGALIEKDTVGIIRLDADLQFLVPAAVTPGNTQALASISGTLGGISSRGYPFTAGIVSPILFPLHADLCAWIREGVITFSPGGTEQDRIIRFPALTSCNDSVYYDLSGTTYCWRMKPKYLWH